MRIGAFEAKNKLSGLLKRVEQGETIEITRRGKPIAELRPIPGERANAPRFGSEKELVKRISDDFTEPLEGFDDYMPRRRF